jgi:branched-chain amino acid transport system permease protein
MLYRENGQLKTSYFADRQIFPVLQDRKLFVLVLVVAYLLLPLLSSEYMLRAVLVPYLIMVIAALGVNVLVGYCGQITLGSGAFMAVGAYGAYNFFVRVPDMPFIVALLLGATSAMVFGVFFGLRAFACAACISPWRRSPLSSSVTGHSCV